MVFPSAKWEWDKRTEGAGSRVFCLREGIMGRGMSLFYLHTLSARHGTSSRLASGTRRTPRDAANDEGTRENLLAPRRVWPPAVPLTLPKFRDPCFVSGVSEWAEKPQMPSSTNGNFAWATTRFLFLSPPHFTEN